MKKMLKKIVGYSIGPALLFLGFGLMFAPFHLGLVLDPYRHEFSMFFGAISGTGLYLIIAPFVWK